MKSDHIPGIGEEGALVVEFEKSAVQQFGCKRLSLVFLFFVVMIALFLEFGEIILPLFCFWRFLVELLVNTTGSISKFCQTTLSIYQVASSLENFCDFK